MKSIGNLEHTIVINRQESVFAPANKKEMNVMVEFFTAITTSSHLPSCLANDSVDLLKITRADVDSVSAVRASLERVANQNQKLVHISVKITLY